MDDPVDSTAQAGTTGSTGAWQGADLHGGGHEEVLLLQAQLLALVGAVVRVQHAAQGLRSLPRQDGLQWDCSWAPE